MRLLPSLLLCLLLAAPVSAAPAAAASLDQAVAQAKKQYGGRILSAKTVEEDGHRVYRIKLLTPKNKVRVVTVPAKDS